MLKVSLCVHLQAVMYNKFIIVIQPDLLCCILLYWSIMLCCVSLVSSRMEKADVAVSPSIAAEATTSSLTDSLFLEKVATKVHNQWMLFGCGLDLKYEALRAIKAECSDDSKLCLMRVFNLWRSCSSSPFRLETIIDVYTEECFRLTSASWKTWERVSLM